MKVRCHCRAKLTFPDERAGKRGQCPKCGAEFIVVAPVVRVPPPPPAPPPPAPAAESATPPKALVVAAACLAVLLVILILCLTMAAGKRGKASVNGGAGRGAPPSRMLLLGRPGRPL